MNKILSILFLMSVSGEVSTTALPTQIADVSAQSSISAIETEAGKKYAENIKKNLVGIKNISVNIKTGATEILKPTLLQEKRFSAKFKEFAKTLGFDLKGTGFWYANTLLDLAEKDFDSTKASIDQLRILSELGDIKASIKNKESYYSKENLQLYQIKQFNSQYPEEFQFYHANIKDYLKMQVQKFDAMKEFDPAAFSAVKEINAIRSFINLGKITEVNKAAINVRASDVLSCLQLESLYKNIEKISGQATADALVQKLFTQGKKDSALFTSIFNNTYNNLTMYVLNMVKKDFTNIANGKYTSEFTAANKAATAAIKAMLAKQTVATKSANNSSTAQDDSSYQRASATNQG